MTGLLKDGRLPWVDAGQYVSLVLIASITVMYQLNRVAVAFGTRAYLKRQTYYAEYKAELPAVELAILLAAHRGPKLYHQVLQSIIDKGGLYVYPIGNGRRVVIRDSPSISPLRDYEDVMKSAILKGRNEVIVSSRKPVSWSVRRSLDGYIYKKMVYLGYLKKQTALQEGVGQYLQAFTYFLPVFSVGSYVWAVGLGFYALAGVNMAAVSPEIAKQSIAILSLVLVVAIFVPIVVYAKSVYSAFGTERYVRAYGFYWYLSRVYKRRVREGYALSASEGRKYGEYFDAFGWRGELR